MPVTVNADLAVLGHVAWDREAPEGPLQALADLLPAWGDWLAIGRDPDNCVWIQRSPLGHLPAYVMNIGNRVLISSDAELLLKAAGCTPAIDWSFVTTHLAFAHLQTAQTGLEGVTELMHGSLLHPATTETQELTWSPWAYTSSDREISTFDEAVSCLRGAIDRAVRGTLGSHRQPLLELSGGVDSSVLAASLARGTCGASAATLVTDRREGDERRYASAAAMASGMPLLEIPVPGAPDLDRPIGRRLARPGLPLLLSPADRSLADLARHEDFDAFVSGAGGDCVFASPISAAPAADVLIRFGLGRRAVKAIDDLARIHEASGWEVARMAWQQSRRGPLHPVWQRRTAFLKNAHDIPLPVHPWLDEPDGVLPGKRSQIRSILAALAHVDGYGRHEVAPSIYPFLSRPVVETALRIPSWLWIEGGIDRAVARRAFSGFLPTLVLERRTKGGLDGYGIAGIEAHRASLRIFLLEGHLARQGIVDRGEIDDVLARPISRTDRCYHGLFPLIDTEAWVRAWLGDP
ncbi:asparagine synthetase B family protein [Novosphingobium sp. PC22D]|uniref:asparagine synthase-related protein n=1 Tax=Novosphingobium sp. PC22D TaxID=1962403 RepID=UPI000BEF3F58|nr:asparagine synthetase B family protein [Novosphingobium sp. PC22D]